MDEFVCLFVSVGGMEPAQLLSLIHDCTHDPGLLVFVTRCLSFCRRSLRSSNPPVASCRDKINDIDWYYFYGVLFTMAMMKYFDD